MTAGLLLDPITGQPQYEAASEVLHPEHNLSYRMVQNLRNGWRVSNRRAQDEVLDRAPSHVKDWLQKSKDAARNRDELRAVGVSAYEPRASNQAWEEVIYSPLSDGTQVIASTTETIMVPDYTLIAGYLTPGRILKYTVIGEYSTVITTPGTIIYALRYGGVAGTALATSGAFAPDPTAANTTLTTMVEWWMVTRAVGIAAASFTVGRIEWNDYDDASAATIVGNLNMRMAPASGSAAVNINTTTANALSPTVKFSVTTATTQYTAHIATIEALT